MEWLLHRTQDDAVGSTGGLATLASGQWRVREAYQFNVRMKGKKQYEKLIMTVAVR